MLPSSRATGQVNGGPPARVAYGSEWRPQAADDKRKELEKAAKAAKQKSKGA